MYILHRGPVYTIPDSYRRAAISLSDRGSRLHHATAIRYEMLLKSERKSLRFVGDVKVTPAWLWHDVNGAIRYISHQNLDLKTRT